MQESNIVDIQWRLDYSIKSKNAGKENVPIYFVTLKVEEKGEFHNINMMASMEEMQDLLSKV
jgi:hypothetical protein